MINVEILSKVKPGGNSYSSRTASSFKQVSSNTGGGDSKFTARVLWGQRFDGTQDVYGDMTIRGRIDECTGLAVSGNAGIGGSLTVDGSIYRAGYTVFDQGNSGVGHGWVQLYPKKEYFLSTNQFGEVTDYVRFLDRIRVDKGISTSVIDASQGNFRNITAYEITTDYLTVTKKAHFFSLVIDEVKAVGGQLIVTPARAKIDLVEERAGGGWRCYFRAEDPDGNKIHNEFEKDDQIICQTFNAAVGISYNVSNTYWWRLCTAVSSTPVPREIDGKLYDCHWFDVSGTDCDYRSDAPAAGDECVLLGNRTDTDRQDAIIISAYRNQYLDPSILSPSWCQYTGIDDYDLSSHRLTWFSKSGNVIRGTLIVENGMTVEDFIEEIIGDTSIDPDNPNSGNYIHFAWGNSASDWTKDPTRANEDWTFLGVCANDTESDSALTYYSYRWTRIKGSSVSNIREYYMRTEAGVQTPSWSDSRWVLNDPPELTETYRWLWNYEEFVFTNTTIKTDPRVIGVFGSGKGIRSVENWYLTTAAGSGVTVDDPGWSQTAEPPTINKPYLWNYEIIYWTDNTSQVIDPHIISVFSDIADISIGFENSYRMLDAGSYAIVKPNDELEMQLAFDLLCISGTTTTRLRPMDSMFPSNISATYVVYTGTNSNQVGGTIQQPGSSSYTWFIQDTVSSFTSQYPYASHVTIRLNIDGNQVDSFSVPVVLQPGSYFSTINGLYSRVQDLDASMKDVDSSVKNVVNRYSLLDQSVGYITGRVSEVSTAIDNASEMIREVSGNITDVSIFAHGLISQVESFQEWFDENGDIVDSVNKISTIEQRCDSIETRVRDVSGGMLTNQSRITQLSDRITSEVSDASNRMSQIEQSVSNISLSVQSGVTSDDLMRTGIDITNGKIQIVADNTEWIGDLHIRPTSATAKSKGLILSDYTGENAIQIKNDKMGCLANYGFEGARENIIYKSGNHSGGSSTISSSFSRTALNNGNKYYSGNTAYIAGLTFNITGDPLIMNGPGRTITSVSITYKIVNGSGTVRATKSDTVYTSEAITRTGDENTTRSAWNGISAPEISYTLTTDEYLYLEAEFTCNVTGDAKSQSYSYTANLKYEFANVYGTLNKLALDGVAFSKSRVEYLWAGPIRWPGTNESRDEFGIINRVKQHGVAITDMGVFRPFWNQSSNVENITTNDANSFRGRWGDISSTTPVMTISGTGEHTLKADTNGCYRYGLIIVSTSSGYSVRINLPDPMECPGKIYYIKRLYDNTLRHTVVTTVLGDSCFMDCDDNTRRQGYGIGACMSMFISTGSIWLHAHLGNWESNRVEKCGGDNPDFPFNVL